MQFANQYFIPSFDLPFISDNEKATEQIGKACIRDIKIRLRYAGKLSILAETIVYIISNSPGVTIYSRRNDYVRVSKYYESERWPTAI